MSRNITANTIRRAGMNVRLPLVTQLLRDAHQHAGTAKGKNCRLAARYLVGNIESVEYDIIARLQLLEAMSGLARIGPNAGTWWKKGKRGLAEAAQVFAGTDMDPSWYSPGYTGLIGKVYGMVHAMFKKMSNSEGTFSSTDDIMQNGIMGLTKSGQPASTGPMFIHIGVKMARTWGKSILSGKETPLSMAGNIGRTFALKVRDEFKEADKTQRRAPTESPEGDSTFDLMPTQALNSVTFWDFLSTQLREHTPVGRKLEQAMRNIAKDQELATALIDHLVAGKSVNSISALSKELGGSGSGGSVRWVKTVFFPEVAKFVKHDRALNEAYGQATRRLASRRKQAGYGSYGQQFVFSVADRKKLLDITRVLKQAGDRQSMDLLRDVQLELIKRLDPDSPTESALSRLAGLADRGATWDPSLIRNNIFKVANSLGMKLPSGMFS